MNLENINIKNKDGEMVVSSREVAKNFGKRHAEVLRTIEDKISQNAKLRSDKYFIETNYKAGTGKTYKEYLMTRDGFSFLVMGFTGSKADEWKIKYIEAFNKMEAAIKNSGYQIPKNPMEALEMMFQVQKDNATKIDKLDEKITKFEENASLSPSEYNVISNLIHERIRIVKSEYGLLNATKQQVSELYKAINHDVKEVAGVYTRAQLRQKDFKNVLELIRDWTPSKALTMRINQLSFDM